MKIFIAGADGFVGSAVTNELAQRGHDVIGMDRTFKGNYPKKPGVSYIKGDLFEGGEWCDRIKEADKVISIINPFRHDEDIPKDKVGMYSKKHTEGVANLIKAASEGRAKSVIVTFHTDCYGNRNGKWVTDADSVDPIGFCRPIADSLKIADRLAEEAGLNIIRVFPASVYGNGGWFKRLIEDMKAGKARLVEPGDNYLNLLHIDDLAGLYAEIVEHVDKSDVFTLSDDRPVTQKDLMNHITALMGLPELRMVDFHAYAREFGWLRAESMSSSTRVPGLKAIDMFGYAMKARSYEQGVLMTLKSMGVEVSKETIEKLSQAA
ncbi:MAG: NAD-dependent epimerase/dehydratase family protein [Nitrospirota bacterium]